MTVVELATGVHRIPTAPGDLVNSFLIAEDDGSVTLVDAGVKSAPKKIRAALAALGRQPGDVQRIVLTHAHPDHAGGLAAMAGESGARVLAHERDAPHLEQGTTPSRDESVLLGRLVNRLPGGGFPATHVSETFVDGQLLDIGGGLRVIHTPGHSPGHVSLLHEGTGTLITGDAVVNVRGLRYAPLFFCTNVKLMQETVSRLGELDFEVAAFTHGVEVRERAPEALRAFLAGRPR